MSKYLAIATVTGALYQILFDPVQSAVPGAVVRFRRPDRTSGEEGKPHVNVYLYQVTPNAAFRNIDLPTHRADGTLVKQPVAALDLHYLFTFHGSDDQLDHGERLVRARGLDQQVVFVEHGVLTRECVRCQPTAGVDPGAEPGHTADARELGGHLAVCDLRQVEPGGVRPDVDDGDAHVSQSKSWAGTW